MRAAHRCRLVEWTREVDVLESARAQSDKRLLETLSDFESLKARLHGVSESVSVVVHRVNTVSDCLVCRLQ